MGKSFHSERIVLFCKPPTPGRVKTRLAVFLGEAPAAALYADLLRRSVRSLPEESTALYSGEPDDFGALLRLFPDRPVFIQRGADLGLRMANAALDEYTRFPGSAVVLVGSDIPKLQEQHVERAFELLRSHDLVLGPSDDGGYYAIGFSPGLLSDASLTADLLSGIAWSTDTVFAQQLAGARTRGVSVGILPRLRDLDVVPDLFYFLREGMPLSGHLPDIRVIIPVLDEVDSLGFVLGPLLESKLFTEVICADNGSTDGSVALAVELGARTTHCAERGYGATCLAALSDIRERGGCDVVLFLDGDGADDPVDLAAVLGPVTSNRADLVLGQRRVELAEAGALPPHARFGNWLATSLLGLLWGRRFRDLGPFRAVRWNALERMQVDDRNFGWTIQMQIRAVRLGLRIEEVDVRNRRRHAGRSKVTGNIRAIARAGWVILSAVFRERRWKPTPPPA